MKYVENEYLNLCCYVMEYGMKKEDCIGIGIVFVFGY